MLEIIKEKTEEKETNLYITFSKLSNKFLEIYFDKQNELLDVKKRKLGDKCTTESLLQKGNTSSVLSENKEGLTDRKKYEYLPDMPELESDEEVKEKIR